MSDLRLSMATAAYDHLRDLVNARVRPEGIDLNAMELPIEEIFHRMLAHEEWDIAEFSMAKYLWMLARGSAPFCALPVFRRASFVTPRFTWQQLPVLAPLAIWWVGALVFRNGRKPQGSMREHCCSISSAFV